MSGHPMVLVVRFGALGDVILATPLLRALHGAYPDAAITLVTKEAWAPLFAAHPHVTRVEAFATGDRLSDLAARLRGTAWTHRLDLHGSLRSGALRVLVGGRWYGWRKPRWRRALRVRLGLRGPQIPPVAEQYFGAVRALGIAPDGGPAEITPTAAHAEQAAALMPGGRYVALAPGAAHATKRWPRASWDRLAELLGRRGVSALVVGADADAAQVSPGSAVVACGIGLGPTAALIRGAAVLVVGDSGLMHLATAVGTPVVALFGPTDPGLGYGPYRARATVVARTLPCRPCSVYGGAHCPLGHHRCMIDLSPDEVADAVEALLA